MTASQTQARLEECERLLQQAPAETSVEERTIRRARDRLDTIAAVAQRLCADAAQLPDAELPFTVALQLDGLLTSLESLSRVLKPLGMALDADTAKAVSEMRRGAFRGLVGLATGGLAEPEAPRETIVPVLHAFVGALRALDISVPPRAA